MKNDQTLIVRQHKRHELSMPAVLTVDGGMVRFSPEAGIAASGLAATVSDLSAGGAALRCGHFLPRKTILKVAILNERGERSHPLLEARLRVQRVQMIDRRPTYALGCAFVDLDDGLRQRIEQVLTNIRAGDGGSPA
ncbi:MAG: PilZ domain-containing protein [Phycisphaerales bacterium]|nr:PilZ domain-containing protein [Phycisphaerales bacterium]